MTSRTLGHCRGDPLPGAPEWCPQSLRRQTSIVAAHCSPGGMLHAGLLGGMRAESTPVWGAQALQPEAESPRGGEITEADLAAREADSAASIIALYASLLTGLLVGCDSRPSKALQRCHAHTCHSMSAHSSCWCLFWLIAVGRAPCEQGGLSAWKRMDSIAVPVVLAHVLASCTSKAAGAISRRGRREG